MFTDMVGYTLLSQKDEKLALKLLEDHRRLIRPLLSTHRGREVKTIGDAFLVEFESALEAASCAVEIQKALRSYNEGGTGGISLRVGIHVGDVVHQGTDIVGDAVNIASRVETQAKGGEICVSGQVFDQVGNKINLGFVRLETTRLKNVNQPIEVYRLVLPWEEEAVPPTVGQDRMRVAVLPFKNMSPDPNDEYFADGMTEELITSLSGVTGLTVIARTSVMQYKSAPKRVNEVGRELRVGTVLEGSVRKAANKLRITIQAIDAGSEGHLWAQNYDRQMDDVFAIQSEIAEKVAGILKVKLVDSEKQKLESKPTRSVEAYTLYLKGRFYWNERTKSSIQKGIEYLKKSVEIDPGFALAYSDLADAHVLVADYGVAPAEEALAKVLDYASKALELEPALSQPHAAVATALERGFQWEEAGREYRKAIELNPNNAVAHHWYALDLLFQGKMNQAIEEWGIARNLDPLSLIIGSAFAMGLLKAGRTEEGLQMVQGVLEMDDAFSVGHRNAAYIYLAVGNKEEAITQARRYHELDGRPEISLFLAAILGGTGNKEEALRMLNRLLQSSEGSYFDPSSVAQVYGAVGDAANAVKWLTKAYEERAAGIVYTSVLPTYDPIRSDPGFKDVLRKMGLNEGQPPTN